MSLLGFMAYWYLYSKWYILGSIFVTHLLNVSFHKLILSPFIVNAVSVILLAIAIYTKLLVGQEIGYSIINAYLPTVFTSIIMNLVIFIYRKIKEKKNEKI